MDKITLQNVLSVFDAPLNEEQAWAICFQCAVFLNHKWKTSPAECHRFKRVNSIHIDKDGHVTSIGPVSNDGTSNKVSSETELLQSLGIVIFQALDYGFSDTEERLLSAPLEQVIERMTGCDVSAAEDNRSQLNQSYEDEGIERDTEPLEQKEQFTLQEVIDICGSHLDDHQDPGAHYKAVCRALITEAHELLMFLDVIVRDQKSIDHTGGEEDYGSTLSELQRTDWARLWMSLMHQLRQGVKLKKVDQHQVYKSVEYELTPYEILMEDIRSRRYNLQKVDQTASRLPPRMKKDAHDVILDFIRSRPPLKSAAERRLSLGPAKQPDAHEMLLSEIRGEPKLKSTLGATVETSRTRLDEMSISPLPTRKVLKPDLSLLMSNSDSEDGDTTDDEVAPPTVEERSRVAPCLLSPLTPLSPPTPDQSQWCKTGNMDDVFGDAYYNMDPAAVAAIAAAAKSVDFSARASHGLVALDLVTELSSVRGERRHSITVCETPIDPNKNLKNSLACLSLTIEEVMHIRNVLTKAELETLLVTPSLYEQVAKGKVCFGCNKVKFSFFGQRATTCKFCQRNVCSRCSTKMRIPTEHFENIPVYTLSPSPTSLEKGKQVYTYQNTGSVPSSPDTKHRLSTTSPGVLDSISNGSTTPTPTNISTPSPVSSAHSNTSATQKTVPQSLLHRARALTAKAVNSNDNKLQGPLMSICLDCKCMVVSIIRASRCTMGTAPPETLKQQIFGSVPANNNAPRDLKLDLQPVYK